jgi:hypothetical protein
MPTHDPQVTGEGTLLQFGTGASPGPYTYATIAQRISLDGPDRSVAAVDTSHLDSTAKTNRPSRMPDNGTVSGTLLWNPADTQHLAIEALIATPAMGHWQLVFNDGSGSPNRPAKQFDGTLTKWKTTGIEVDSNVEVEFEIKVSGTIATAAA